MTIMVIITIYSNPCKSVWLEKSHVIYTRPLCHQINSTLMIENHKHQRLQSPNLVQCSIDRCRTWWALRQSNTKAYSVSRIYECHVDFISNATTEYKLQRRRIGLSGFSNHIYIVNFLFTQLTKQGIGLPEPRFMLAYYSDANVLCVLMNAAMESVD